MGAAFHCTSHQLHTVLSRHLILVKQPNLKKNSFLLPEFLLINIWQSSSPSLVLFGVFLFFLIMSFFVLCVFSPTNYFPAAELPCPWLVVCIQFPTFLELFVRSRCFHESVTEQSDLQRTVSKSHFRTQKKLIMSKRVWPNDWMVKWKSL